MTQNNDFVSIAELCLSLFNTWANKIKPKRRWPNEINVIIVMSWICKRQVSCILHLIKWLDLSGSSSSCVGLLRSECGHTSQDFSMTDWLNNYLAFRDLPATGLWPTLVSFGPCTQHQFFGCDAGDSVDLWFSVCYCPLVEMWWGSRGGRKRGWREGNVSNELSYCSL